MVFPVKNRQSDGARWTPSRFRAIWAPTSHTLGEICIFCWKMAKNCQKKPKNFHIHITHEKWSFFDGRPESGVRIAFRPIGKKLKFKNGCEIDASRGAELLFGKNQSILKKTQFGTFFGNTCFGFFWRKKVNFQNLKEKFWINFKRLTWWFLGRKAIEKKKSWKRCSFFFFFFFFFWEIRPIFSRVWGPPGPATVLGTLQGYQTGRWEC